MRRWLLLPILICLGCGPARIAQETWTVYEPNAPLEVQASSLSVAVAPLADVRRRGEGQLGGWSRWDMARYAEDAQLCGLFARWLAEDLKASGLFPQAEFRRWSELEGEAPELIVTGELRRAGASAHWIGGSRGVAVSLFTPVAPLLMLGIPVGWVDYALEIEVQVFRADDLGRPIWKRVVSAEDTTPNTVYTSVGDLLDGYLFAHNQTLRPLYAEVLADLAGFVGEGGLEGE